MNLERAQAIAYDLRPAASDRAVRSALDDIRELEGIEARHWKPRIGRMIRDREITNAGGLYYQDTRQPFLIADTATVTLTTTSQLLWPVLASTPTYPADWFPGKLFMLRCFGRITTVVSGGPLIVSMAYGTASNTGILSSTASLTITASQSNISWRFEGRVRCRAVASAGGAASSLLGTGMFESNVVTTPSSGGGPLPASAPAAITNADLTATSGINLQMTQTTTAGSTVVVHDIELAALN